MINETLENLERLKTSLSLLCGDSEDPKVSPKQVTEFLISLSDSIKSISEYLESEDKKKTIISRAMEIVAKDKQFKIRDFSSMQVATLTEIFGVTCTAKLLNSDAPTVSVKSRKATSSTGDIMTSGEASDDEMVKLARDVQYRILNNKIEDSEEFQNLSLKEKLSLKCANCKVQASVSKDVTTWAEKRPDELAGKIEAVLKFLCIDFYAAVKGELKNSEHCIEVHSKGEMVMGIKINIDNIFYPALTNNPVIKGIFQEYKEKAKKEKTQGKRKSTRLDWRAKERTELQVDLGEDLRKESIEEVE